MALREQEECLHTKVSAVERQRLQEASYIMKYRTPLEEVKDTIFGSENPT